MNLSAPKKIVYWISMIVGLLAILAAFVPAFHIFHFGQAFWSAILAWVILAAGNLLTDV